jgi:SAM-dependent methyltransferase
MGKRRLTIIKSLLPDNTANAPLLDIGCAYGPFLAAAKEEGFSPHGIDPSEDAVRYVTEILKIPAIQGFFPFPRRTEKCPENKNFTTEYTENTEKEEKDILKLRGDQPISIPPCSPSCPQDSSTPWFNILPFSVITLWYVIEHFRDCVPVLKEIRKLLKPGGVLAFATPSFSGVSGRFSLRRFLEHSPADHWTIWSPAMCKKALKNAGFRVKKNVNSGHHPERFPLLGKYAKSRKSPLYWLLLAASKIFSLGDTFEVYATTQEQPK